MHQFSKVEMFVVCTPDQSAALLEDLADLEKDMFTELGLHFKILVCILGFSFQAVILSNRQKQIFKIISS